MEVLTRTTVEELTRTVVEERAERIAQAADAAKGAGERSDDSRESAPSRTAVPSSMQGAHSGTSQRSLSHSTLTQSRPPKFDNVDR